MTKKTEGGESYSASAYLVAEDPESPSTWHLRVRDADGKPNHTLMGAAWAALHQGYRGNTYAGPNKAAALSTLKALYTSEGMDTPVEMSADLGTRIIRRGPIFALGAYPDKQFSLSADEAQQAVAAFQPVPIDSEHKESVFDGKLGALQQIELRGETLYGSIAVPPWLHELFADTPLPVSTTWSRGPQKQIIGLALAKHPRVSEAAMMAAFSAASTDRHDTFDGQELHQAIHDMAARHGAICNAPAAMVSKHESTGLQKIHDTTIEHGAACRAMGQMGFSEALALFAGKRHSGSDQQNLDAAHEAIVKAGANCPATMSKERAMTVFDKDWWANLFSGAQQAGIEPAAFQATGNPATTTTAPPADSDEVKRLRAELAKAQAERITSDATHFADAQIAAHKALPAEREAIIAAFTQAAQDDAAHGVVTFADGKTASRVALLTAAYTARPAHTLTQELIADATVTAGGAGTAVAFNQQQTPRTDAAKPMTPERRKELLQDTDLGRAVLNGNKH